MQQLYIARDRIEAQLLGDFLDRRLIRTVLLRDSLSGAAGELPADIAPTLWLVDDEDLPRARELIAEFLAPLPDGHGLAPWTCPSCGELVDGDFERCWNCSSARTE